MRIVVIGNGKMGQSIVRDASKEGHSITIIDEDPKIVDNLVNSYDVMGICGNGAILEIQKEAGVQSADLVVAATPSDEINLLSCFIAHKLGASDTIARVRDPQYLKQIQFMKEDLGLSMTINPDYEAAKAISRTLSYPAALKVEPFTKGKIELVEIVIEEGSILDGLGLFEIPDKLRLKVLVCAVERDKKVIIPFGNFILKAGDHIHVVSSHADLTHFFQKSFKDIEKLHTILIVGGGRISFYFCQLVIKNKYSMKLIEHDEKTCKTLSEKLSNVDILLGDGTDQDTLETEGIKNTDAFLALTGVDEENIIVSMFAKKCGVKKIITKVNNSKLNSMMESIGMASVFSPTEIAVNQVISYIRAKANKRGSNVVTLYKLVDQRVEALEFFVKKKSRLLSTPLKKLKLKPNIIIAAIIRNNEVVFPNGEDTIEMDDNVIVITTDTMLDDLNEILG